MFKGQCARFGNQGSFMPFILAFDFSTFFGKHILVTRSDFTFHNQEAGVGSLLWYYVWWETEVSQSSTRSFYTPQTPLNRHLYWPLSLLPLREEMLGYNYKATKFHSDTGSSRGNIGILWLRPGESRRIVAELM